MQNTNLPNDKFKEVIYKRKRHSQNKYQTGTAKIDNNLDDKFRSTNCEKENSGWYSSKKTIKNYIKNKKSCNDNELTVQCVKNKTRFNKKLFPAGNQV